MIIKYHSKSKLKPDLWNSKIALLLTDSQFPNRVYATRSKTEVGFLRSPRTTIISGSPPVSTLLPVLSLSSELIIFLRPCVWLLRKLDKIKEFAFG